MPKSNEEIRFWSENLFAGDVGTIDGTTIRGVSVITGGQEAEGHGLTIDDETLRQLQACAKERGKVPVTLDHGSGIKDINGYLTGFRFDNTGDHPKLRADWHLLDSHPETRVMLEKAEKMPTCFGLSVAFKGPPKGVPIGEGKMAARCEKLLSVDVVTRPAANEGLFSVPSVDKAGIGMAKEKTDQNKPAGDTPPAEPTMAQIMEAIQGISGRLDQQEQFLGTLQQPATQEDGPSLEQLTQMDDAELAKLGITREDVNNAVQQVMAEMEGQGDPEAQPGQPGQPAGQQTGEGEMVGAGAPAGFGGGEAPATFQALAKRVIELENKIKFTELSRKREAEEIELASIEEKVTLIAKQRDEALTELKTKDAEVAALRLAVKTGTRPVIAGQEIEGGIRMFGANENGQLHEFQVRVKQLVESGKSEGQAIQLAVKENPGRHADYVQTLAAKKAA